MYASTLVQSDEASRNASSLTVDPPVPIIPGMGISFTFDHGKPLRTIEVYQTAIEMMYGFAQRGWEDVIHQVDSQTFEHYNVIILFINPQPSEAPVQLQVKHCVAALYRTIVVMTDAVLFCSVRCHLTLDEENVAALSITAMPAAPIAGINTSTSSEVEKIKNVARSAPISTANADRGHYVDPDNRSFSINYYFMGRPINSKEVSVAILEAMTAAAPYRKFAECEELSVVSPDGGCAIFIESKNARQYFTYKWATRALKILYQQIIVPQRRFGDVFLELKYGGEIFGELRMLRILDDQPHNRTSTEMTIGKAFNQTLQ